MSFEIVNMTLSALGAVVLAGRLFWRGAGDANTRNLAAAP